MTPLKEIPLYTDSAAVYLHDPRKRIVAAHVYNDAPVPLFHEYTSGGTHYIRVARELAPLGADKRTIGLPAPMSSAFKPRDAVQSSIIERASKKLLAGESFIIEARTGLGKTVMGLHLASVLGRVTFVIVHKDDLIQQWIKEARDVLGLSSSDIGIIKGDNVLVDGRKIVVCSLKSVCKKGRYPEYIYTLPGLIIFDECHRVAASMMSEVCWMFPAKWRLGLSATASRSDGLTKVLESHIGPLAIRESGITKPPVVYYVRTNWKVPLVMRRDKSTGKIKVVPKAHSPGRIAGIATDMAKDANRNNIIVHMTEAALDKGRSVLILCSVLVHVEELYAKFVARGYGSIVTRYTGQSSKEERHIAELKRLKIATVGAAGEGTNWPDVDTVILATPVANPAQLVGRALRDLPGKKTPVVVDLVDSDSPVLRGYQASRARWYSSIGAKTLKYDIT